MLLFSRGIQSVLVVLLISVFPAIGFALSNYPYTGTVPTPMNAAGDSQPSFFVAQGYYPDGTLLTDPVVPVSTVLLVKP